MSRILKFFVVLAAGFVCFSSCVLAQSTREAMEERIKEEVKSELSGGGYGESGGGIDKESLKDEARRQLGVGGESSGPVNKEKLKAQVKQDLGLAAPAPKAAASQKKAQSVSFDNAMKGIDDPTVLKFNKCAAGMVVDSTFTSFGISLWGLIVESSLYRNDDGTKMRNDLSKTQNIVSIMVQEGSRNLGFDFSLDADYLYARFAGASVDGKKVDAKEGISLLSVLREKQAKRPFSQAELDSAVYSSVRLVKDMEKPWYAKMMDQLDIAKVGFILGAIFVAVFIAVIVTRPAKKKAAIPEVPQVKTPHAPEKVTHERVPEIKKEDVPSKDATQQRIDGLKTVYSAIDIYDQIEKLSKLKEKGVITSGDFEQKKKELLDRI